MLSSAMISKRLKTMESELSDKDRDKDAGFTFTRAFQAELDEAELSVPSERELLAMFDLDNESEELFSLDEMAARSERELLAKFGLELLHMDEYLKMAQVDNQKLGLETAETQPERKVGSKSRRGGAGVDVGGVGVEIAASKKEIEEIELLSKFGLHGESAELLDDYLDTGFKVDARKSAPEIAERKVGSKSREVVRV